MTYCMHTYFLRAKSNEKLVQRRVLHKLLNSSIPYYTSRKLQWAVARDHTVLWFLQNMKQCWYHHMGLHHNAYTECKSSRGIRNETVEISSHTQAMTIRQLYCLAVVMFSINPCYNLSVPHTFNRCNSHLWCMELWNWYIIIINHVGTVASVEVHDYVDEVCCKSEGKSRLFCRSNPWCIPCSFYWQYIDIMQRHAQVYVSSSERMTGMEHHYSVLSQTDVNQNGGQANSQVQDDTP